VRRGAWRLAQAALLVASTARADAPPVVPVSGVLREEQRPGDGLRAAGAWALYPLRHGFDLAYVASGNAAALLEREAIVPRYKRLTRAADGSIAIYPTFRVHKIHNYAPVPGLRLVSSRARFGSTLAVQYGDGEDWEIEGKLRFGLMAGVPFALSLEGFHESYTYWFEGVGQSPASDPRNHFVGAPGRAYYVEKKQRALASFGARPSSDLEVFISSSYLQRTMRDPAVHEHTTLRELLRPESVDGAERRVRLVYQELTVRYDSRPSRGGPQPGALLELYGGSGRGVLGERAHFMRAGATAAAYVQVARLHNVLSPRLVLDTLAPVRDETVPFSELPRQPAFRGVGDRRDFVSLVASLDYRWRISRALAGRLYTDLGRVAPSLRALPGDDLRVAVGAGADLYGDNADVGRAAITVSRDGVGVTLSFGAPPSFGDRQHRD